MYFQVNFDVVSSLFGNYGYVNAIKVYIFAYSTFVQILHSAKNNENAVQKHEGKKTLYFALFS